MCKKGRKKCGSRERVNRQDKGGVNEFENRSLMTRQDKSERLSWKSGEQMGR